MRAGRQDLVCLYSPQQVLPALAAAAAWRQSRDDDAPLSFVLWSEADGRPRREKRSVVEAMLESFPFARLWTDEDGRLERTLRGRLTVGGKARALRQLIDGEIGAIYYPHDLTSDFLPRAAAEAFPRAERVCFGDGLGMVYSRAYFERHLYGAATLTGLFTNPMVAVRQALARLRRRVIAPAGDLRRPAYALVMPHDPSGECLPGSDVTVVPRDVAARVRHALAATVAPRVAPMIEGLPAAAPLILLGSFSESRMCDEEAELDLYCTALARHVAHGATLVIKAHNATGERKLERLVNRLAPHYNPTILDRGVADIPIELLDSLLANRPVVSFSHASVALAYFGLGRAAHALTDDLIAQTFPSFIRPWVVESNRQYLTQQRAASGLNGHE